MSIPEFGKPVRGSVDKSVPEFGKPVELPSRIRSIASAPVKGAIKEARKLWLVGAGEEEKPGEENFFKRGIKKVLGIPEEQTLFEPQEKFEAKVNELLPTREGFAEKALERGGRALPLTAAGGLGGGASLVASGVRSLLSGLAGEGVKELGGGDLSQSVAEMLALGLPSGSSKILATGKQKPLVDFARKMGLTEQEIAPLIQGDKKVAFLGKLSNKRGRPQKALGKSRSAASKIYENLKSSPEASMSMSEESAAKFLAEITTKLKDMPSGVRSVIRKDALDMVRDGFTGKSLINFYQDVNHYVGKGVRKLGLLQEPITKAMGSISPGLAEDFFLTNRLWANHSKLSAKLKPTIVSDLITAGKIGLGVVGAATGNYTLMTEAFGGVVARKFASELLTNPRMQNLSKKMISALNASKIELAKKIMGEMIEESNPEQTR